jgi:hypothetical protein
MDQEIRAMTLSMAVEWTKTDQGGMTVEEVIEIAKAFEKHIKYGTGLS